MTAGIRLFRAACHRAGHHGVDDLVRPARVRCGGRAGNSAQPAIVCTQSPALMLSIIPGKYRRNSAAAVDPSMVNIRPE
jgi:hypothetical protein